MLPEMVFDAIPHRAMPALPVFTGLALAIDALLSAEDITELTANWPLIEHDVEAAIEVREMLGRRRRWAVDYDQMMTAFRAQLIGAFRDLLQELPDPSYLTGAADDAPFSVPISSVLERPAAAIENLVGSFYDADLQRLGLFKKLRDRLSQNVAVASGLPRGTQTIQPGARLITPTQYKDANPTSLVDAYLSGTPLADVFSIPVPFRVPEALRFEHAHIVGGTGHGKTQLLQRMIHADLVAAQRDGRSVVVIDSQGDLIRKLLRLEMFAPEAPDSLADRLILIDPSDVEFPPSLNLFDAKADRLEEYSAADRERALNGLVELYETFFGALLGAELTQKQGVIFRYLARLMMEIPGATIHTLMQIMEDGKPFRLHMEALDGSARYFFETEFFHPSFSATKKQILKRLWGVLSTPAFERMFAQRDNKLDLFEATNAGKIILINTAKDLLKTDGSALFGRFFIAMIAQATLERSVIPERLRTPTFVYVDEAQEYFDDTIETILSQGRKYKTAFAASHQTLEQLSPQLRAAFLANTSLKCVGGVSAKDARALASELHTSADFIESMRRRQDHTEFAMWLKGRTPDALRMDVPLGFLERQSTLTEDEYDELIALNRARYCGSRADVLSFGAPLAPSPRSTQAPAEGAKPIAPIPAEPPPDREPEASHPIPRLRPPVEERELGKGGAKHRYLQSLVKELGEQQGFRATIEAPLPGGAGQIDVLLEQGDVAVAVEISVSTPVEQEQANIRKCLDAGYGRIALVLAKSRITAGRYRATILEPLAQGEQARITFLAPEDIPDFIASCAPAPASTETIVKGYRVKVSQTAVGPDEARARRERLAKLVARSLREKE